MKPIPQDNGSPSGSSASPSSARRARSRWEGGVAVAGDFASINLGVTVSADGLRVTKRQRGFAVYLQ